MPELPEVTTTVNGLQKRLPRLIIKDVWTDLAKKKVSRKDFEQTIKSEKFFNEFKKKIIGQKVISVKRRAKNILIHISGGHTIIIHMKMTGHLLFGEYKKQVESKKSKVKSKMQWVPKDKNGPLNDPYNRFIHVVWTFDNGKHLAFCDSRKFGKVTIINTKDENTSTHLKGIGPEPLDKDFDFKKFKEALVKHPSTNWKKPMKQILMDQYTVAGIGNIYSDEMLWLADIHPESKIKSIPDKILKNLFKYMKQVLEKGIDLGGDSMSDYRNVDGERGNFQNHHNVYRKEKEKCGKRGCSGAIIKKVIGGRSAHFCPIHQTLYK